jgi:uncharacterized membrane protein HdeD (DUF308 family)
MDPVETNTHQSSLKDPSKSIVQLIWGVALCLAGIGVFFRIPQVMPQIEKIEYFSSVMFFIRFSFYLIGILLVAGGIKKIYHNYFKKVNIQSSS